MTEADRDPVRRFAGYGLVTVGGLMAALAGLCGGAMLLSSFPMGLRGVGAVLVPLMLGSGIPVLIGVLALRSGLRAARTPAPAGGGDRLMGGLATAVGATLAAGGLALAVWTLATSVPSLARGTDPYAGLVLMLGGLLSGPTIIAGLALVLLGRRTARARGAAR